MKAILSRRLAELPASRAQWNALVAAMPGSTIFQTYEWFECWWNAFGHDKELFVITLWDGAALSAIAPLMIVRRLGLRQLEFVGSPNGDYQNFVLGSDPDRVLVSLATFLRDSRREWDALVLRNLPMDSITYRRFPGLLASLGINSTDLEQERVACPTIMVSSRPAETRQILQRYSMRRRIKALQQAGDVTFRRCTTHQEIDRELPRFFAQYVERRRGTAAAASFMRPEVTAFYSSLAHALLTNGWLHFSVLECGGRAAAFHLGFEYGGRLYWYKPSFDPALSRLSPGKVLLSHLVRDALERGLNELDFTVGAEAFKYRFADTQRTNANVRAFASAWLYHSFRGMARARQLLGRLRRRLRR